MPKSKNIVSNNQAESIAADIYRMFVGIENICNHVALEIIPEDEMTKVFIRTRFTCDSIFEIGLYNSSTKTVVLKHNSIIEMLTLAQAGLIEELLRTDIKKLYIESIKKINEYDTEIVI